MKRLSILAFLILFLSISLSSQTADTRGLRNIVQALDPNAQVGRNYALLIAVDRYREWLPLTNPVRDAREIKTILEQNYYFDEIFTLFDNDASAVNIRKKFSELQDLLDINDSLFIFYAGHGHLDIRSNNGFWIPVDAGMDGFAQTNWINNDQIRGWISNFKSKHVLLISDSCFSGNILVAHRSAQPEINNEYFRRAYNMASRQVLTSGASETVPDSSEFALQVKQFLRNNNAPIVDPLMMFSTIRQGIRQTQPLFGSIAGSGHQEGASFLFFKRMPQTSSSSSVGGSTTTTPTTGPRQMVIEEDFLYGTLEIDVYENGKLYIDNEYVRDLTGGRRARISNVTAGEHIIKIEYEGSNETNTISLPAEETLQVRFNYRRNVASTNAGNSSIERATPVSVNNNAVTVSANFTSATDIDWYKFTVPSGGRRTLIYTESDKDTIVELTDRQGNQIASDDDGGEGLNGRIDKMLAQGEYFINIKEYNKATGDYSLHIDFVEQIAGDQYESNNSREAAKPIRFTGDTTNIECSFHTDTDEDWFKFTIPAGGKQIIIASTGTMDTKAEIFNSAGESVGTDDDSGDENNFRLERQLSAGDYYLKVIEYYKNSGSYSVSFTMTAPLSADRFENNDNQNTAKNIPISGNVGTVTANFHTNTDIDWFKFTVPVGGKRVIISTEGGRDTFAELFDRNGQSIISNDDAGTDLNAMIDTSLNQGEFFVKIKEYNGASGEYTVKVEFQQALTGDSYESNNDQNSAKNINLSGNLTTLNLSFHTGGDIDWFKFNITGSARRVIIYTESDKDTKITVNDRQGNQIAFNDDSGEGNNARIDATLNAGEYFIKVEEYNNAIGNYVLKIEIQQPLTGDSYEPNNEMKDARMINLTGNTTVVNANFHANNDVDWYKIRVTTNNRPVIISTESTLDTQIEVFNATSSSVGSDDDSGTDYNARAEITLPAGDYFISIKEYNGASGNYTLKIELNNTGSGNTNQGGKTGSFVN